MRDVPSVLPQTGRGAGFGAVVVLGLLGLVGCESTGSTDRTDVPTVAESTELARGGPAPDASTPAPTETLLPTESPTDSLVGALAPSFPADLLPVPAGAEILVSSVLPVGDDGVREISLNLRSTDSAASLMDAYRAALLDAGFEEAPPAANESGLAEETTFTRSGGDEILVVGILDKNDVRTVAIGGRVRVTP